jgi:hypothetical protein
MKMKWINLLALIILSTPSMTFAQIPRKDVLICELPNGDQFILTSKYKWSLYFNPHNGQRSDRESWDITFKKSGSFRKSDAPSGIRWEGFEYKQALIDACAEVGMIAGIPIVGSSYLRADGTWFPPSLLPEKLYLSHPSEEKRESIRNELKVKDLFVLTKYALVFPRKNRLVFEQPILGKESGKQRAPVMAVFKSISHDDGKTWSDPEITEDAEIYELGKSPIEQSFIARPVKINGKKVVEK